MLMEYNNNKPVSIKILQIEDDDDQLKLMNELLIDSTLIHFEIFSANSITQAKQIIAENELDILLIDLNLSETKGINTFYKTKELAPSTPIIIISAIYDEELALEALNNGAQDFLTKKSLTQKVITRSILFAIERSRFKSNEKTDKKLYDEIDKYPSLTKFSFTPDTPIASKLYSEVSLREGYPEIFQTLVDKYKNLIKLSLEEQLHNETKEISENLRALSEEIGFLKAGPKDIVEVHSTAIKELVKNIDSATSSKYTREGEIILLGLMGNLALFYRTYYFMIWKKHLSNTNTDTNANANK